MWLVCLLLVVVVCSGAKTIQLLHFCFGLFCVHKLKVVQICKQMPPTTQLLSQWSEILQGKSRSLPGETIREHQQCVWPVFFFFFCWVSCVIAELTRFSLHKNCSRAQVEGSWDRHFLAISARLFHPTAQCSCCAQTNRSLVLWW